MARTGDLSALGADQKKAVAIGALAAGGVLAALLLGRKSSTPPPPPPPPPPPTVPTGLSAVAISSTRVNLSWNSGAYDVSYAVYRDAVLAFTTGATSVSDPNVSAQSTYVYSVVGINSLGAASASSAGVSVTTPPTPPNVPAPPTDLAAVIGGSQTAPIVTLTWDTSAGATIYDIYRNGQLLRSVP